MVGLGFFLLGGGGECLDEASRADICRLFWYLGGDVELRYSGGSRAYYTESESELQPSRSYVLWDL